MGANGCSREMICSSFGGQQICPMALVAKTKLGSNQPAALFRKEPTTASHTCTAAVCFPLLHVFVIFRIYFWLDFPSALQLELAWGLLPSPVLPVWVEAGGRERAADDGTCPYASNPLHLSRLRASRNCTKLKTSQRSPMEWICNPQWGGRFDLFLDRFPHHSPMLVTFRHYFFPFKTYGSSESGTQHCSAEGVLQALRTRLWPCDFLVLPQENTTETGLEEQSTSPGYAKLY